MIEEIWKDVDGYRGLQVSNLGNARLLDRLSSSGSKLKARDCCVNICKGYRMIAVYNSNDKFCYKKISRFVAECFLGKSSLIVDHINGEKTDDRLENLQYVTNRENVSRSKNNYEDRNITYHKKQKKWCAKFTLNKKTVHAGKFDRKEDAIKARDAFVKLNPECDVRKEIY